MSNLPSAEEMLRRLIATPSVSSVNPEFDQSNIAVVELLAQWLSDLGFEVTLNELPGKPHKKNLIAVLGRGPGGLVLAGHTDTVPYDEGSWSSDPFVLERRDGRYFGLGTADMKGFFPLALEAVRVADHRRLTAPIVVLATADEESSMAGARALAACGLDVGRYAVIGEPTAMAPVRMHKGVVMHAIRIFGKSGHASDPSLGNNALEGMYKVMGALLEWRASLQEKYRDPTFAVSTPTINLGHIHGGDNPNRICGDCELQIDMRFLPGMIFQDIFRELTSLVEQTLAGSGLRHEVCPLMDPVPPMETAAGAEIVKVAERLTGSESQSAGFASEAPFFNSMGMETILLGPGDIEMAHQPDEFLLANRVQPAIDTIGELISHFCR